MTEFGAMPSLNEIKDWYRSVAGAGGGEEGEEEEEEEEAEGGEEEEEGDFQKSEEGMKS